MFLSLGTAVLLMAPVAARADKFAGDFMAIGAGARALGMGGAFSAAPLALFIS